MSPLAASAEMVSLVSQLSGAGPLVGQMTVVGLKVYRDAVLSN